MKKSLLKNLFIGVAMIIISIITESISYSLNMKWSITYSSSYSLLVLITYFIYFFISGIFISNFNFENRKNNIICCIVFITVGIVFFMLTLSIYDVRNVLFVLALSSGMFLKKAIKQ